MDKIRKYYFEATARAKGKKGPWNSLGVVLFIIGSGSSAYLMIAGFFNLQHRLIPSGTILSGGSGMGFFLMFALPLFLSFAIGTLFANCILWCIPTAWAALNKEAQEVNGITGKESTKIMLLMTIILTSIFIPLALAGTYNYFYVTTSGITFHPLFSIRNKEYGWNDIVKIHAGCFVDDRNTLNSKYILYMRDGRNINLWTNFKFINSFDKIKPYIRSQKNIFFDYRLDNDDIEKLKEVYPGYAEKIIQIIKNEN